MTQGKAYFYVGDARCPYTNQFRDEHGLSSINLVK